MKKINGLISVLFILGALALAGCSKATPQPAQQIPGATPSLVIAAATLTPPASLTPEASKALLIAPAGSSIQAAAVDLSAKAGLTLISQPALQKSDLTPAVRLVVLQSAPADLAGLLAAAPHTEFIVVSATDLPAAQNLTVIRTKVENQAFVEGYISVLLSTDFRAAGLLTNDGPADASVKDAYVNGGRFFCGVCGPGWPLKVYYPLVGEQPSTADGPTWQTTAASLFDNQKVEVYYLSPAATRPEVIAYLQGKAQGDKPLALLGEKAPPDGLKAQWAATVHFDLAAALQQVWPDVTSGKSVGVKQAPLLVDNTNPALLGAGKMRLVKDLMGQLEAGTVLPNSVPAQ